MMSFAALHPGIVWLVCVENIERIHLRLSAVAPFTHMD